VTDMLAVIACICSSSEPNGRDIEVSLKVVGIVNGRQFIKRKRRSDIFAVDTVLRVRH
jgi:hypothetical protein